MQLAIRQVPMLRRLVAGGIAVAFAAAGFWLTVGEGAWHSQIAIEQVLTDRNARGRVPLTERQVRLVVDSCNGEGRPTVTPLPETGAYEITVEGTLRLRRYWGGDYCGDLVLVTLPAPVDQIVFLVDGTSGRVFPMPQTGDR